VNTQPFTKGQKNDEDLHHAPARRRDDQLANEIVQKCHNDDIYSISVSSVDLMNASHAGVTSMVLTSTSPRINLRRFTRLEHLDISNARFSNLGSLSSLTTLIISMSHMPGSAYHPIIHKVNTTNLTGLVHLELGGVVLDDSVGSMSHLTSLRRLALREKYYGGISALSHLSELTGLTHLDVSNSKVLDVHLMGLTQLRHLNIEGCTSLFDESPLVGLKSLEYLNVGCTTLVGLSHLDRLTHLVVSNHFKVSMPTFPALSVLEISGGQCCDTSAVSQMTTLTRLTVRGANPFRMETVDNLKSLTHLDLIRCRFRSDVTNLNILTKLKGLTHLNVSRTDMFANLDTSQLSRLTALTIINDI
jgi:internalin A